MYWPVATQMLRLVGIALLVLAVAVAAANTKTRSLFVTVTIGTGTSDVTLTETMTASTTTTQGTPTVSSTSSKSETITNQLTQSFSTKNSSTKSSTADNTFTVSVSSVLTATKTRSVSPSDSVTISSTETADLTRSRTTTGATFTKEISRSVTLSSNMTFTLSAGESKSVTLTSWLSQSFTVTPTSTRTPVSTHTKSIGVTQTLTQIRQTRTRYQSGSVTITLPITFTATSLSSSLIITPTLTLPITATTSLTQGNPSASASLRDTFTRTLQTSHSNTTTDEMSVTETSTMVVTNTTTIVPSQSGSLTSFPSLTASGSQSKSRTVTLSWSKTVDATASVTPTVTDSGSPSATETLPPTPTLSVTDPSSASVTASVTNSTSPTLSSSPTVTDTLTESVTVSLTGTQSFTDDASATRTETVSKSFTDLESNTHTRTETSTEDVTVTVTRTLTPPPTLTLTLTQHEPVRIANLFSLGLRIFADDTAPCMRVVMYIGLFPFAGLLFAALYSLVMAIVSPKVDVDTFSSVKQWRSLLALHSYFSILFPCHYHCAVHHALMGLIHYNLTTGIVAAITLSLNPQTNGSVVIALTSIFAAVTPHLARPFLSEMMYYYSFDKRDLHRLIYVDLDSDAEDGPEQPDDHADGGESPQALARKARELEELAEEVPPVGDLAEDGELSSMGDVELPETEAPLDEKAFKALNSFVFHFTEDTGGTQSQRSKGISLKSIEGGSGPLVVHGGSQSAGGDFDNFFGEFTPMHTPREDAPQVVDMDGPGLFPYMPVDAKGLWKFLFLCACFAPVVALNFILTKRMQDRGNNDCGDELNGFMKSLTIALVLDVVVFQQVYLAILMGLRIIRSKDDNKYFSELHPYSGEMRPLHGQLLRAQMTQENQEVRKALDAEQQRRKIEERMDLDDHIEIIAAPEADVPQTLDPIEDRTSKDHSWSSPKKQAATGDQEAFEFEEVEEVEEEEEDEEEESEEEKDPVPQSPPRPQQFASFGGNMMMAMMHNNSMSPLGGQPRR